MIVLKTQQKYKNQNRVITLRKRFDQLRNICNEANVKITIAETSAYIDTHINFSNAKKAMQENINELKQY